MEYYGLGGSEVAAYRLALLVIAGISARHRHDGYRCARVCFYSNSVQPGVGCGFEHGQEVGSYAGHDGLCFRVAHADVVLDYERFAAAVDEAEEYEASIVDAFGSESGEGRLDDAAVDFSHKFVVDKRRGAYGAHAAGVEPGVAFADSFVVLGRRQHYVFARSVGEYEYGAFYA